MRRGRTTASNLSTSARRISAAPSNAAIMREPCVGLASRGPFIVSFVESDATIHVTQRFVADDPRHAPYIEQTSRPALLCPPRNDRMPRASGDDYGAAH